jgi:epoxyqueuosine reductase
MQDNDSVAAVSTITELVKQAASEAGFELAGVATVREFPELDYFPQWLSAGYGGDMKYLETRDASGRLKRASLSAVAPWARSVVVCAKNYNTAFPHSTGGIQGTHTDAAEPKKADRPGRTGWISRYAWSHEDYHDSVLRRLKQVEARLRQEAGPETETRCYVDTGPLVERVYAKYAGVGWIGKNTCVIHQKQGSWLFLGVILTSLELEPDLPAADRCGTCRRCLDACPTNAFPGPYQLDASRCISYLTIEKRGTVPAEFRAEIGRHVFGCDICQEVCPWNRKAPVTFDPEFQPRPNLVNPALDWLACLSEAEFREVFRRSPVKRAKRSGIRRNAVIAMGNSGNREFLPQLQILAEDSDPVVAEHARWAMERLRKKDNQVANEKPSQQDWEGTG